MEHVQFRTTFLHGVLFPQRPGIELDIRLWISFYRRYSVGRIVTPGDHLHRYTTVFGELVRFILDAEREGNDVIKKRRPAPIVLEFG